MDEMEMGAIDIWYLLSRQSQRDAAGKGISLHTRPSPLPRRCQIGFPRSRLSSAERGS